MFRFPPAEHSFCVSLGGGNNCNLGKEEIYIYIFQYTLCVSSCYLRKIKSQVYIRLAVLNYNKMFVMSLVTGFSYCSFFPQKQNYFLSQCVNYKYNSIREYFIYSISVYFEHPEQKPLNFFYNSGSRQTLKYNLSAEGGRRFNFIFETLIKAEEALTRYW